MHRSPPMLVLGNAWDAASARIFEVADFPAIATTSAGVANALGYPDRQQLPFEEMLSAIARIVRAVRVPVSADMEAGYGETPEAVADHCRSVIAAGAVGVNLEDGTGDADRPLVAETLHCEKIRAVREASSREGIHLVINARTDVYLASVGAPQTRLAEALRRANAYRRAGADCLFVPAVTDAATIGEIVRGIEGPVNVLAGPGHSSRPRARAPGSRPCEPRLGPDASDSGAARAPRRRASGERDFSHARGRHPLRRG